jgi:RHS repeat-associated protein
VIERQVLYAHNYTDHLGNVRLSYGLDPEEQGQLKILAENHYYPYGLKHSNYNAIEYAYKENELGTYVILEPTDRQDYRYKYNGIEFQDELGLNLYDMDFRDYDPAIARWTGIDPVTHHNMSPYMAFDGNPVFWADPSGADAIISPNGITFDGEDARSAFNGLLNFLDGEDSSFDITGKVVVLSDSQSEGGSGGGGNNPPGVKGSGDSYSFFGIPIRFISSAGNSASYFLGAINISPGLWQKFLSSGLNSRIGFLLMHEFGHSLQEAYSGKILYNYHTAPSSLISFLSNSHDKHDKHWTEIQASTLAYFYFGMPAGFETVNAVNENYVSSDYIIKIINLYLYHPDY